MPITITADALRDALRLDATGEETAEVTRLLAYATAAAERYGPDAPEAVANEAVVRIAGYLLDAPTAPRGSGFADALTNSGAAAILSPWRVHRGGKCETT